MLEIRDLTIVYGAFRAVDGVSLSVPDGKVVGVVGANGAGKSSLINAVSGVVPPTSGAIAFEGESIVGKKIHEIAELGIAQVPEGRRLFPEMTVGENLYIGAHQKRARAKRDETYEMVCELFPRLREREKQAAKTLSGGEQQMVAVGRALMSLPKLLLIDEISLGLAPIVIQQIFKTVLELKDRGMTILLVEQNVHHCLAISDYAYVLETGRVVIEGEGEEVAKNPHTRAAYLGLGVE